MFIKTEKEIQLMRESGKILQAAQKAMKDIIVDGVTLLELDRVAEKKIRSLGAKPAFKGFQGFPNTICTMINSEVVHGIPDMRKLKNGDLISIDCGAIHKNFYSDAAFTVIVGGDDKNPVRAKFSNTVKRALEAGCDQARPGNRLGDIGFAIQNVVEKAGYKIIRDFTGHGIGKKMHEDPHVLNYGKPHTGMKLKEGMTLCIEPIVAFGSTKYKTLKDGWTEVTLDGKDACQWEHCGVITKNGYEIFA